MNGKAGRRRGTFLLQMAAPAAILIAVLFFFTALSNLDSGQEEQALLQLEESLRRASAACFAAEGIYPPDLDYLKEQYGIQVDEEEYYVHYEIFGSNIMPDITVRKK